MGVDFEKVMEALESSMVGGIQVRVLELRCGVIGFLQWANAMKGDDVAFGMGTIFLLMTILRGGSSSLVA